MQLLTLCRSPGCIVWKCGRQEGSARRVSGTLFSPVRRNIERFPGDFMFELTADEFESLRCHFGTSNLRSQIVTSKGRGGRRYNPLAFTEQGVAMLSSVLRSQRAVQVNIAIMRAFVKLREMLASNHDLARRLDEMEKKYDAQFKVVFDAIRQMMSPPAKPSRKIGFRSPSGKRI
jgi:hypothetical protein